MYCDENYIAHYGIIDKDSIIEKINSYYRYDISFDYSHQYNYSFSYNSLSKDEQIKLLNEIVCYKLNLKYIEIYVIVHKTWYLIFTNRENETYRGYVKPINTFNYNILEDYMPDDVSKRSFLIENILK